MKDARLNYYPKAGRSWLATLMAAAFLSLTQPSWADESARIYRSGYYLGRGDTGIASCDNHDAIFYNPAAIAQGKGIYKETVLMSPLLEMSRDTRDLIRQVAVEQKNDVDTLRKHVGKNQHLGIYNFTGVVFRRMALGAVASNQTNILVKQSPEHGGLETVSANTTANTVATLSLAESFFAEQFLVGMTGKYFANRAQAGIDVSIVDAQDIAEELDQDDVMSLGSGSGVDLGFLFKPKSAVPWSLGLTVENVGTTKFTGTAGASAPDDLKQIVNIGMAVEPGRSSARFKLLFDYRDVTGSYEKNTFKKTHIGTEIALGKVMGFTAGLNQGYPTIGTYLNLYILRFDLGAYAEEIGDRVGVRPDPRFYFRMMGGF